MIIGNVCNHLMIEQFTSEHSDPLRNASARKIWLAEDGDVLVTQRPVSAGLKAHVQRITGLSPERVTCLDPGDDLETLAAEIREMAGDAPVVLAPYALEHWVTRLSDLLGGSIDLFDGTPPSPLVDLVYRLNTKSGFREVAAELGLPMPAGLVAEGRPALEDACRQMLCRHDGVMVKLDRSSNGYGNLPLSREDLPDLSARLENHFAGFGSQPDRYMVEEFLAFAALPSVEMTVRTDGLRFDYVCDQRLTPKAGMATPPAGLERKSLSQLEDAGKIFGAWLHSRGYRGVFDVDGGMLADGSIVFTETNTRRTAGSHLHDIARRLLGPEYLSGRVWLSGSAGLAEARPMQVLEELLDRNGLLYDAGAGLGAVLPVDHVTGERCFYQIFAASIPEASETELRLQEVLAS
ncbi:MAG: hypothetical protein Tsb0019_10580 [Roseibium sp.]